MILTVVERVCVYERNNNDNDANSTTNIMSVLKIRREAQADVGSERMVSRLAIRYTRSLVKNLTDSVNKFKSVSC